MMGIIISIHEFGHLVAAKIFNVYVSEYSIGMGPLLWSKQYKETKYSLRLLPLGGYCAMAGDNENDLEPKVDDKDIPYERTLKGLKWWKKIIVMLGGIFMNLILAWIIYSMILLSSGSYVLATKPQIESIAKDYPAYRSKLKVGDIITEVSMDNGMSIKPQSYTELVSFLSIYDGNGSWKFVVDRDGQLLNIEITPEYYESEGSYLIGVTFSSVGTNVVKINILNCFYYSINYMGTLLRLLISSLGMLIKPSGIKQLSGPVGIYQTVEQTSELGLFYYFQLVAYLSMNVGIMNALPLPIFDGGRVVLTFIEAIIRKPINKKIESLIMSLSMAILILLFILVTYNDIFRLFK